MKKKIQPISNLTKQTKGGPIIMITMDQFQRTGMVAKMVDTNKQFGNTNIADQQATSRVIYAALPLDGRTVFNFFEGVEAILPLGNIGQNKLQVQESLVVRRIRFEALLFDEVTGAFEEVTDITTAGVPEFFGGDYSILFDTTTVQKRNPLSTQLPVFSKNARHTTNEWILLDTNQTIIPDVEFTFPVQVPPYTAVANAYVRIVVEGFGTLLSPKSQF